MNQPPLSRRAGRWMTPARWVDFAVLLLVPGCLAVLWVYRRTGRLALALSIAGCLTVLGGIAATRLCAAARARARATEVRWAHRLWFADEMAFSPDHQLRRFASDILQSQYGCRYDGPTLFLEGQPVLLCTLRRHISRPVTADDILACADQARAQSISTVFLAATAHPDDSAQTALGSVRDVEIHLLDMDELADQAWESGWSGEEEQLEKYWQAAHALRLRARPFSGFFSRLRRPLRFGFAALLLGLPAAFTPFPGWYLAASGVCLTLGVLSAARQFRRDQSCK
ncbi:MAG: hypothetical protein PHD32_00350 [Eubacteriales bacterium]|nr:hypothetical protein [Eubacteriales bacterium]